MSRAQPRDMLFGIDCAAVDNNKQADWVVARRRGPISFALIRATWGTTPDSLFTRDWPALKAAGLTRGAYMYLRFPHEGKTLWFRTASSDRERSRGCAGSLHADRDALSCNSEVRLSLIHI